MRVGRSKPRSRTRASACSQLTCRPSPAFAYQGSYPVRLLGSQSHGHSRSSREALGGLRHQETAPRTAAGSSSARLTTARIRGGPRAPRPASARIPPRDAPEVPQKGRRHATSLSASYSDPMARGSRVFGTKLPPFPTDTRHLARLARPLAAMDTLRALAPARIAYSTGNAPQSSTFPAGHALAISATAVFANWADSETDGQVLRLRLVSDPVFGLGSMGIRRLKSRARVAQARRRGLPVCLSPMVRRGRR